MQVSFCASIFSIVGQPMNLKAGLGSKQDVRPGYSFLMFCETIGLGAVTVGVPDVRTSYQKDQEPGTSSQGAVCGTPRGLLF